MSLQQRRASGNRVSQPRRSGLFKPGTFSQKHSQRVIRGTVTSRDRLQKTDLGLHQSRKQERLLSDVSERKMDENEIMKNYAAAVNRQAYDSLFTGQLVDDILKDLNHSPAADVTTEVNCVIDETIGRFIDELQQDNTASQSGKKDDLKVVQLKQDIERLLIEGDGNHFSDEEVKAFQHNIEDHSHEDEFKKMEPSTKTGDHTDKILKEGSGRNQHRKIEDGSLIRSNLVPDAMVSDSTKRDSMIQNRLLEVENIFYGNDESHEHDGNTNTASDSFSDNEKVNHRQKNDISRIAEASVDLEPIFDKFDEIVKRIPDTMEEQQMGRTIFKKVPTKATTISQSIRQNDVDSNEPIFREQVDEFEKTLRDYDNQPRGLASAMRHRGKESLGERYRAYYCEHLRKNATLKKRGVVAQPLCFQKWVEKVKEREASMLVKESQQAKKRYEMLRRRSRHKFVGRSTSNDPSKGGKRHVASALPLEARNAREVEVALVQGERELADINTSLRKLARERQLKRKQIVASRKSARAMSGTIRELVPIAAKLAAEVACRKSSGVASTASLAVDSKKRKSTIEELMNGALQNGVMSTDQNTNSLKHFIAERFSDLHAALDSMGDVFADIEHENDIARSRFTSDLVEPVNDWPITKTNTSQQQEQNSKGFDDYRQKLIDALAPDKFGVTLSQASALNHSRNNINGDSVENENIRSSEAKHSHGMHMQDQQGPYGQGSDSGSMLQFPLSDVGSLMQLNADLEEDSLDEDEILQNGVGNLNLQGVENEIQESARNMYNPAIGDEDAALHDEAEDVAENLYSGIVEKMAGDLVPIVDIDSNAQLFDEQMESLSQAANIISTDNLILEPMQLIDMDMDMAMNTVTVDGNDEIINNLHADDAGLSQTPRLSCTAFLDQPVPDEDDYVPHEPVASTKRASTTRLPEKNKDVKSRRPHTKRGTFDAIRASSPKRASRTTNMDVLPKGDISDLLDAPGGAYFREMRRDNEYFDPASAGAVR